MIHYPIDENISLSVPGEIGSCSPCLDENALRGPILISNLSSPQSTRNPTIKAIYERQVYRHFTYLPSNSKGKPDRSLLPFNTKKLNSGKKYLTWICISHLACKVRYSVDTTAYIHEGSGIDTPSFCVRVNNESHGEHLFSPVYGVDLTVLPKVLQYFFCTTYVWYF